MYSFYQYMVLSVIIQGMYLFFWFFLMFGVTVWIGSTMANRKKNLLKSITVF